MREGSSAIFLLGRYCNCSKCFVQASSGLANPDFSLKIVK
nr:MAG TPA: hypothetical protein [Caudoviricetes sp.]